MNTNEDTAQGVTHHTDTIGAQTQLMLLDNLTREHTAFGSFHELLDAKDGYFPSFPKAPQHMAEWATYRLPSGQVVSARTYYQQFDLLAMAYDQAQEARGDIRRAQRS